jgi:uncharacterized protein YjiS (DUF1127 family)
MTTICCPEHTQVSARTAGLGWAQRLKSLWRGRVQAWREVSRMHAELRALDGLDDRTLHDIGLAERRMGRDLPGSWRDLPGAWRDPRNVL